MKRCDNCFEVNSDGATNCVICGEAMDVPQLETDGMTMSATVLPPVAEDAAPVVATYAGQSTEVMESQDEAVSAEPQDEPEAAVAPEPEEITAAEAEDEPEPEAAFEPEEIAAAEPEDEPEPAATLGPEEIAAAEAEDEPELEATLEPEEIAAAEPEDEPEPAAALERDEVAAAGLEDEPELAVVFEADEISASELDEIAAATPEVEPEQISDAGRAEASVESAAMPPASPLPTDTRVDGQAVLQVFHNTEPRVVHSHRVVNDVTLIGREDPQRDVFPDLDLGKLMDQGVSVTRVSRQHLRLLRQGDRYFLFVYRGSTGTQLNKELVDESRYGKRFEIQVGDRIVLGGQVRLKLAAGM